MMLQAIQTKFFGPGNRLGARVKAIAEAGSVTVAWDHTLGIEANHVRAARTLAVKIGWEGEWHGGALPGSGYAFVITNLHCGAIEPDFTIAKVEG